MAAAAAAAPQEIPKQLPKIFHRFVGNGVLFKFLVPYEKFTVIKYFNSVYHVAPASKWGLSIVPLMGVFSGEPPVEKIDLNTSVALLCTGVVWMFYAMIITPQNAGSRALAAVNISLAGVNGFNVYRKVSYDLAHPK